jgi:hypothetical protein
MGQQNNIPDVSHDPFFLSLLFSPPLLFICELRILFGIDPLWKREKELYTMRLSKYCHLILGPPTVFLRISRHFTPFRIGIRVELRKNIKYV